MITCPSSSAVMPLSPSATWTRSVSSGQPPGSATRASRSAQPVKLPPQSSGKSASPNRRLWGPRTCTQGQFRNRGGRGREPRHVLRSEWPPSSKSCREFRCAQAPAPRSDICQHFLGLSARPHIFLERAVGASLGSALRRSCRSVSKATRQPQGHRHHVVRKAPLVTAQICRLRAARRYRQRHTPPERFSLRSSSATTAACPISGCCTS